MSDGTFGLLGGAWLGAPICVAFGCVNKAVVKFLPFGWVCARCERGLERDDFLATKSNTTVTV